MRICFIADANSIHARNWIEYFCTTGNDVFVLSSVRNPIPISGATTYDLYSGDVAVPARDAPAARSDSPLFRAVRGFCEIECVYRAGLLSLIPRLLHNARRLVRELHPDILHCLRLPVEGYIGGLIGYRPLVISSWGDDFVYFAARFSVFRWLTKTALSRADVHFADNIRDRGLGLAYGFSSSKLTAGVPSWGGLKLDMLPCRDSYSRSALGDVIVSPRGFGSPFVDTGALVRALPQVLSVFPDSVCLLLGDKRSASYSGLRNLASWIGVEKHCRFIDRLGHPAFLDCLSDADVSVSASLYDGCSVSLIESMACGVIPVVSNDTPKREWVTDGFNGYLFDPRRIESIAGAIIKALENRGSFEAMRQRNRRIVEERADYYKNMKIAEEIYRRLLPGTAEIFVLNSRRSDEVARGRV